MQFSRELRESVLSGDITASIRRWTRPQVKVGNRYQVAGGAIEVDSVELIPFSSLGPDDVTSCGEPDLETLRRRAAHAGPIHDDTLVFRVEFHPVDPGPDSHSCEG